MPGSAENIDNQQTLIIDHAEARKSAPPAAGLLLNRRQEQPEAFGLQAATDSELAEMNLPGFRYRAGRRPTGP